MVNISELVNQSTEHPAEQQSETSAIQSTNRDQEQNQTLRYLSNQSANLTTINQANNRPMNKPTKQPQFQPVISNLLDIITKPNKPSIHETSHVKNSELATSFICS
jgi:hypothetical protein